MDSQDGLNYLGRIIACCSMRIVSRTGGVVVCYSVYMLKAPGSSPGIWCMWSWGRGAIPLYWWCILILNEGEITHLVVHMDLE